MITEVVGLDGMNIHAVPMTYQAVNSGYYPSSGNYSINNGYGHSLNGERLYIGMPAQYHTIANWAMQKIKEEQELTRLAETNTTIQDLLVQKEEIDQKIKTVQVLLR